MPSEGAAPPPTPWAGILRSQHNGCAGTPTQVGSSAAAAAMDVADADTYLHDLAGKFCQECVSA